MGNSSDKLAGEVTVSAASLLGNELNGFSFKSNLGGSRLLKSVQCIHEDVRVTFFSNFLAHFELKSAILPHSQISRAWRSRFM